MNEIYRLETRDRPRLLFAMMHALAAEDSRISFEGALSQTELARMAATHEETGVLKRATFQPKQDFLVLRLTPEKLSALEKAIISKIPFGNHGIIHVQIERNGRIAFAAYDNFDRECVVAYSDVSSSLLDELTNARILRGYQLASQSAR
jgi:hypothetical protein